jgi:hypothetical protein
MLSFEWYPLPNILKYKFQIIKTSIFIYFLTCEKCCNWRFLIVQYFDQNCLQSLKIKEGLGLSVVDILLEQTHYWS